MLNFMNLLRSKNQYNSAIPLCIHQNGYNENGQYQVFTKTCRNYTWHFHILMVEYKLASTKTGHMYTHRKCICMFTKRHVAESHSSIIAPKKKLRKCPSKIEPINELGNIYMIEYNIGMKINGSITPCTKVVNLTNTTLSEGRKVKNIYCTIPFM